MLDLWPCTDDQRQHLERLLGLRPSLDAESAPAAAADVRALHLSRNSHSFSSIQEREKRKIFLTCMHEGVA